MAVREVRECVESFGDMLEKVGTANSTEPEAPPEIKITLVKPGEANT